MNYHPERFLRFASLLLVAPSLGAQCAIDKVTPFNAEIGFSFGRSVAISGDHALIGSIGEPFLPAGGLNAGAAYLYQRDGFAWIERTRLISDETKEGDLFGQSVALEGDVAVIGALGAGEGGRVHVFERIGHDWVETAELAPPQPHIAQFFGNDVAVSGDRILVGAMLDTTLGSETGAAYLYERAGGSWRFEAKLTAADAQHGDLFGGTVALQGDRVVVGAPHSDVSGFNAGAVYIFEATELGWEQRERLTVPEFEGDVIWDKFGVSVALDGERLLAGRFDPNSVHVYELDGGRWNETASLTPSQLLPGDLFGARVALEGDTALVGAPLYIDDGPTPGPAPGAAYLFESSGGAWMEVGRIPAPSPNDKGGFPVEVDLSGGALILGNEATSDAGAASGAAYFFSTSDADCPDLFGTAALISSSAGGRQRLLLEVDADFAGMTYLTLGSFSGDSPGVPVSGVPLPLNFDSYTGLTLVSPQVTPIAGAVGIIDEDGRARITFALAPGTGASAVGLQFHHACILLGDSAATVEYASNAVDLGIVP